MAKETYRVQQINESSVMNKKDEEMRELIKQVNNQLLAIQRNFESIKAGDDNENIKSAIFAAGGQ